MIRARSVSLAHARQSTFIRRKGTAWRRAGPPIRQGAAEMSSFAAPTAETGRRRWPLFLVLGLLVALALAATVVAPCRRGARPQRPRRSGPLQRGACRTARPPSSGLPYG